MDGLVRHYFACPDCATQKQETRWHNKLNKRSAMLPEFWFGALRGVAGTALGASSSVKSQDYIWITWHLQHVGLAGTKLWSATACANVALESQKPNTPFCSNPSEFSSRWTLLRYVVCLWQQTHWLSPMAPDLQLMPRNHSWPNNRDSFWLTSAIFTEENVAL